MTPERIAEIDTQRLAAWLRSSPRKPAALAFTSGEERQVADLIEAAERDAAMDERAAVRDEQMAERQAERDEELAEKQFERDGEAGERDFELQRKTAEVKAKQAQKPKGRA